MVGQLPEEQRLALTAEDVFNAYQHNEAWAKPIVLDSIDHLAQMVATLSVCFDPDCIVLSGSMGKFSDLLIDQILARIDGVIPLNPKLVVSTLGHRASVMGIIVGILYNTSDFYQVRKLA